MKLLTGGDWLAGVGYGTLHAEEQVETGPIVLGGVTARERSKGTPRGRLAVSPLRAAH